MMILFLIFKLNHITISYKACVCSENLHSLLILPILSHQTEVDEISGNYFLMGSLLAVVVMHVCVWFTKIF